MAHVLLQSIWMLREELVPWCFPEQSLKTNAGKRSTRTCGIIERICAIRLNGLFRWVHWVWKYLLSMVAVSFQYSSSQLPGDIQAIWMVLAFRHLSPPPFCLLLSSQKWYLTILLMIQTLIREKKIIIAFSPLGWLIPIRFSRKLKGQVVALKEERKNQPSWPFERK